MTSLACGSPVTLPPRTDFALTADDLSTFVQDEWQATAAVTVNAGLRHDVGTFADWDPRLGVAWTRSPRMVVRGSFGYFSGRAPWTALAALGAVAPDYPRTRQASGGIEWEWMPRTTFAFSYLDGSNSVWQHRAFTAELQRRFWQGTHYRGAYTFGQTDGSPQDMIPATASSRATSMSPTRLRIGSTGFSTRS